MRAGEICGTLIDIETRYNESLCVCVCVCVCCDLLRSVALRCVAMRCVALRVPNEMCNLWTVYNAVKL